MHSERQNNTYVSFNGSGTKKKKGLKDLIIITIHKTQMIKLEKNQAKIFSENIDKVDKKWN